MAFDKLSGSPLAPLARRSDDDYKTGKWTTEKWLPGAWRWPAVCATSIIVIGLLLLVKGQNDFIINQMQEFRGTSVAPRPSQLRPYYEAAAANLSNWESDLVPRMFELYRSTTTCQETGCPSGATEPEGHARFDLFHPIIKCPPGMSLRRWGGDDDGGKWVCGLETFKAPCAIVSLGSNGQFDFEMAMLDNTPCEVHSFDCTYDGHDLAPRHKYHKLCLGGEEKAKQDSSFVSLGGALELLGGTPITLLKMDIEGWEYDILSSWKKSDPLPLQLCFELHYGSYVYYGTTFNADDKTLMWKERDVSLGEMTAFMSSLARLGYAVVSKENNHYCPGCCEFTVMKVRNVDLQTYT